MTTLSSIKISFSNRKYVFNDFDTSTQTEILFNNFEINSALGNPTVLEAPRRRRRHRRDRHPHRLVHGNFDSSLELLAL